METFVQVLIYLGEVAVSWGGLYLLLRYTRHGFLIAQVAAYLLVVFIFYADALIIYQTKVGIYIYIWILSSISVLGISFRETRNRQERRDG